MFSGINVGALPLSRVPFSSGSVAPPTGSLSYQSTLALWLNASNVTLDNTGSTTVSSWNDASPFIANASQATKSSQPNYSTNALNGRPGVVFTGSQFLELNAAGRSILQNLSGVTLFVVARPSSINWFGAHCYFTTAATGARFGSFQNNQNFEFWGRRLDADSFASIATTTNPISVNTPYIHILNYDYNNRINSLYRNSTTPIITNSSYSTAGNSQNLASQFAYIGCQFNAGSQSSFFNGTIFELLIYQSSLSSSNMQLVLDYLNSKYQVY